MADIGCVPDSVIECIIESVNVIAFAPAEHCITDIRFVCDCRIHCIVETDTVLVCLCM